MLVAALFIPPNGGGFAVELLSTILAGYCCLAGLQGGKVTGPTEFTSASGFYLATTTLA